MRDQRQTFAALGVVSLAVFFAWVAHRRDTRLTDPRAEQTARIVISDRVFHLDIADDEWEIERGLGFRTGLAEDGGMIFVFDEPSEQMFVMRDCVIPIDVVFLDATGAVLAVHEMVPEPPRSEAERAGTEGGEDAYVGRLRGYSSGGEASFAIEVRGGTAKARGVVAGDRIQIDLRELQGGTR